MSWPRSRTRPFQHVVDDRALERPILRTVGDGAGHGIPLLVGATTEEARLALPREGHPALDASTVEAMLAEAIGPESAARVRGAYAAASDRPEDVEAIHVAIESDRQYGLPATQLAEAHAAHEARTWTYRFDWKSPDPRLGACHCIDLAFVFGTFDVPGVPDFSGSGEAAQVLADQVQDAWLAFTRTGDPNHAGLPRWPAFTVRERSTMVFNRECTTAKVPDDDVREAWRGTS